MMKMMTRDEREAMQAIAAEHPRPLVFATVSGAHLYGFPSPDSDFDLRGAHLLAPAEILGLSDPDETLERSEVRDGREIDLVTHDIRKFMRMMLRRNGYVLEQLLSPLVVATSPEHAELVDLAGGCVTRHHLHHYLGFARNQWRLFEQESPRRAKPLLYVYRVLLTGIHLLRTGEVEASLPRLNESFRLPYVDDLIAIKVSGAEQTPLGPADLAFHETEYLRLLEALEAAGRTSPLPEAPTARGALNDLLIRLRLKSLANEGSMRS